MEKIIIWVVLMVGALLYEQIKKRMREKREQDPSDLPPHNGDKHQRIRHAPPVILDFEKEGKEERPVVEVRRRFETPISRASRLKPVPVEGECALTEHHLHPESDDLTADTPSETIAAAETEDASRAAHFDRWRQAIIDTQILERKF